MDQETIRLIVAAGGAVLAGLLGAIVAGRFNRKNTDASIAASREAAVLQWELSARAEQEQWLRDRKVEVYADHLAKIHDLELAIAETHRGIRPRNATPIMELSRNMSTLSIRLFAPEPIQDAVDEVRRVVATIMRAMSITDEAKREPVYEEATKLFNEKAGHLERLIRQDLGVEELVGETA
jgi:hypothetical protein